MYSMPTLYIGEAVRAHVTRTTVKVWLRGAVVSTHARSGRGESQIDPLNYPQGTGELATRDGATLPKRAQAHGSSVGTYAERLQAGPAPWRMARHVYRLLGLCKTYGPRPVDAACHKALELDVVDVQRISRMLSLALEQGPNVAPPVRLAVVTSHRWATAHRGCPSGCGQPRIAVVQATVGRLGARASAWTRGSEPSTGCPRSRQPRHCPQPARPADAARRAPLERWSMALLDSGWGATEASGASGRTHPRSRGRARCC